MASPHGEKIYIPLSKHLLGDDGEYCSESRYAYAFPLFRHLLGDDGEYCSELECGHSLGDDGEHDYCSELEGGLSSSSSSMTEMTAPPPPPPPPGPSLNERPQFIPSMQCPTEPESEPDYIEHFYEHLPSIIHYKSLIFQ